MIVKRFLVMGIANEIANTGVTNVTIVQHKAWVKK